MKLKNKTLCTFLFLHLLLLQFVAFSQPKVRKNFAQGNAYATMFFEYFYVATGDDDYGGNSQFANYKAGDNAFSFRRVYLGYAHTFSDKFVGKVQIELTDKTTLNNGNRAIFLKEANITWKEFLPNTDLIIGHCLTPIWSIEGAEFYWQYRSVERTIADMRNIRKSNDSGVRLKGVFNQSRTYGYNFMIGNGNGAKNETDRYKLIQGNIWVKMFDQRLYLELFGDYNNGENNRYITTTKSFCAWKTLKYTIALELVHQTRAHVGLDGRNQTLFGWSTFAHSDLIPERLRVFGRLDFYDPDVYLQKESRQQSSSPFDELFYTIGFDYTPIPNIHFMPNVYTNLYNKVGKGFTPKNEVIWRMTVNVNFK